MVRKLHYSTQASASVAHAFPRKRHYVHSAVRYLALGQNRRTTPDGSTKFGFRIPLAIGMTSRPSAGGNPTRRQLPFSTLTKVRARYSAILRATAIKAKSWERSGYVGELAPPRAAPRRAIRP